MVNFPTAQEMEELKTYHEPSCLSVYVPYVEPNTPENPSRIQVKNLLRDAEVALLSSGASGDAVRKTLLPIRKQMEQNELRPARKESLAFFSHPNFFRCYHIPNYEVPYSLTVGSGFNIEAIEQVMQMNKPYFVLALSHKSVRLYEGNRDTIDEIEMKNFPHDMLETLRIDEFPKSAETHSIASARTGKGSEAVHEQYNVRQVNKTMLKEFFRLINKHLHPYLQKYSYPLILAGVKYELAMYMDINTYPNVLTDTIVGNIDEAPLHDIRARAWGIVSGERKREEQL
jgi:hypothetical protein